MVVAESNADKPEDLQVPRVPSSPSVGCHVFLAA